MVFALVKLVLVCSQRQAPLSSAKYPYKESSYTLVLILETYRISSIYGVTCYLNFHVYIFIKFRTQNTARLAC